MAKEARRLGTLDGLSVQVLADAWETRTGREPRLSGVVRWQRDNYEEGPDPADLLPV